MYSHIQGSNDSSNNLLAQAISIGPQKQINRQEAYARASIVKGAPGQGGDKKGPNMMQNAVLGGLMGSKQSGIGIGLGPQSKMDHMKNKELKNKKALQENSLVALAADNPELYVPITLPFFNDYAKEQQD